MQRSGNGAKSRHWRRADVKSTATAKFINAGKARRKGKDKGSDYEVRVKASSSPKSSSIDSKKSKSAKSRKKSSMLKNGKLLTGTNIIPASVAPFTKVGRARGISKNDIIDEPSPILRNLYLGAKESASDLKTLTANRIECIINCSRLQVPNTFEGKITYVSIKVMDEDTPEMAQRLRKALDAAFNLIDHALKRNVGVLVHCVAGVSRSATVVAGYLMRRHSIQLYSALKWVKYRRSISEPNKAFICMLAEYEIYLFGYSTVLNAGVKEWDSYALKAMRSRKCPLLKGRPPKVGRGTSLSIMCSIL